MLQLSQAVLNALDEDVLVFNTLFEFIFPNETVRITDSPSTITASAVDYEPNSDLLSADITSLGDGEFALTLLDYDKTWDRRFTDDNYASTKLSAFLYIADTAFPLFSGPCFNKELSDEEASVKLVARFKAVLLDQNKVSFLTDDEQRKRGAGDDSLKYINETLDIAWGRLVPRTGSRTPPNGTGPNR